MNEKRSERALRKSRSPENPIELFDEWFREEAEAGTESPEAATLATASPRGVPSARVILTKRHDERGVVFFTNYESRKGREMDGNRYAALVFYWQRAERQVRIAGGVERVSAEESDEYFDSRARESRLGAWASKQSCPIPNRAFLEQKFEETKRRFEGREAPRPPYWGGYRIVPERYEFWQGRPHRLHDRLVYTRHERPYEKASWTVERLSP